MTRNLRLLAAMPFLLVLAVGCGRQVVVASEPGVSNVATLSVGNQTDWSVLIEAQPPDDPAGTLTLGQVGPNQAVSFENLPANQPLTLRATVLGRTRMLTRPQRTFQPGETVEWLLRPGDAWRAP